MVVTASNGLEGVALFRSTSGHFDLILTDLRMPAMDGHQLVKLVRETSSRAKIICMSSAIDEPIPANTEFLHKPFDMNDLYERIDELLHHNSNH
jgi:two-component system, cell cycle response regulator CpdR